MKRWALFFVAVIAASQVSATVYVNTTVIASSNRVVDSRTYSEPDWLGHSDNIQVGESSAFAQSNLRQGTLRAGARADSVYYTDYGFASAWMRDTVTFPTWVGHPVRLYFSFHAAVSRDNLNSVYDAPSNAEFQVRINDQVVESFSAGNAGLSDVGHYYDFGYIEWVDNPGPISLLFLLSVTAQGPGEWIDAGNTARFYLDVPDGVTYTSTSGAFLADALPIPEPASALLLAAGLVGVLTRMRLSAGVPPGTSGS